MRISFTERELDIMAVLWEFGPSTAAEVRQRLSGERLLMFDAALTRATIIADSAGTTGLKYGATASPIIPYIADSTLFLDRTGQALVVLDPQGKERRSILVMAPHHLPGDNHEH